MHTAAHTAYRTWADALSGDASCSSVLAQLPPPPGEPDFGALIAWWSCAVQLMANTAAQRSRPASPSTENMCVNVQGEGLPDMNGKRICTPPQTPVVDEARLVRVHAEQAAALEMLKGTVQSMQQELESIQAQQLALSRTSSAAKGAECLSGQGCLHLSDFNVAVAHSKIDLACSRCSRPFFPGPQQCFWVWT